MEYIINWCIFNHISLGTAFFRILNLENTVHECQVKRDCYDSCKQKQTRENFVGADKLC